MLSSKVRFCDFKGGGGGGGGGPLLLAPHLYMKHCLAIFVGAAVSIAIVV